MSLTIRRARADEAGLVHSLVRELAEYEKLLHEVEATEADNAEWNGEPAGFALWFVNFSSFAGKHGIYLEDLFVRPALRGKGIGKALLKHLAKECLANGWAGLQVGGVRW